MPIWPAGLGGETKETQTPREREKRSEAWGHKNIICCGQLFVSRVFPPQPQPSHRLCVVYIAPPIFSFRLVPRSLPLLPPMPQDSLASLEVIARVAQTSISMIEARHASLRRVNLGKASTWAMSLDMLAAYFVMLRSRRVAQGPFSCSLDSSGPAPRSSRPARRRKAKVSKWAHRAEQRQRPGWRLKRSQKLGLKRSHGGGAWRAFVSERASGVPRQHNNRLFWRQLGSEYRALPQEELQRLQRKGRAATIAWRQQSSGRIFPRRSELPRHDAQEPQLAAAPAAGTPARLAADLAALQVAERNKAQLQQAKEEADKKALVEYQETASASLSASVKDLSPDPHTTMVHMPC